ncbi:MAG TPA: ribonuclease HII [Candidatus Paceibacterota bacterium]|nr:ribonuclease HII [Candidatus Paceibacterota bacterium]
MKWVVGIDEVGRGALAGPVTVVAVMLAVDARGRIAYARFRRLKDSKKLTAAQREFWAKQLTRSTGVRFAVARIYPRGIERLNISGAANRAALRAFSRLLKNHKLPKTARVYLDGGLFLGSKTLQRALAKTVNVKTVIKGDEKFAGVAAASIIAKVSRDGFMVRLAKKHPQYGFEIHKGYGTAAHLRALKKNGPCAAHRLTFLIKRPNMKR